MKEYRIPLYQLINNLSTYYGDLTTSARLFLSTNNLYINDIEWEIDNMSNELIVREKTFSNKSNI